MLKCIIEKSIKIMNITKYMVENEFEKRNMSIKKWSLLGLKLKLIFIYFISQLSKRNFYSSSPFILAFQSRNR